MLKPCYNGYIHMVAHLYVLRWSVRSILFLKTLLHWLQGRVCDVRECHSLEKPSHNSYRTIPGWSRYSHQWLQPRSGQLLGYIDMVYLRCVSSDGLQDDNSARWLSHNSYTDMVYPQCVTSYVLKDGYYLRKTGHIDCIDMVSVVLIQCVSSEVF